MLFSDILCSPAKGGHGLCALTLPNPHELCVDLSLFSSSA